MSVLLILSVVLVMASVSFELGRRRAHASVAEPGLSALHSLPSYHGWYAGLGCGLPGLAILALWLALGPGLLENLTLRAAEADLAGKSPAERALFVSDVKSVALGNVSARADEPAIRAAADAYAANRGAALTAAALLAGLLSLGGAVVALRGIRPDLTARVHVERAMSVVLMASSLLAILVTVGIVLSLVFETARFFREVSPRDFLFGLHWSPQTALRADQVGSSGSFGAVPVFAGTLLITGIAMSVAVPLGLWSAIYMTFYARDRVRAVAKPMLEILAGVPTVVYGVFAALVVAPVVRDFGTQGPEFSVRYPRAGIRPVASACGRRTTVRHSYVAVDSPCAAGTQDLLRPDIQLIGRPAHSASTCAK